MYVAVLLDLDADILATADALAIGGQQRIGDRLHHLILRQTLLMDELGDSRLKFASH